MIHLVIFLFSENCICLSLVGLKVSKMILNIYIISTFTWQLIKF